MNPPPRFLPGILKVTAAGFVAYMIAFGAILQYYGVKSPDGPYSDPPIVAEKSTYAGIVISLLVVLGYLKIFLDYQRRQAAIVQQHNEKKAEAEQKLAAEAAAEEARNRRVAEIEAKWAAEKAREVAETARKAAVLAAQQAEQAKAAEKARRIARRKELEDDLHDRFQAYLMTHYGVPPEHIPNAFITDFMHAYTNALPSGAGLLHTSQDGFAMRCIACATWFPPRIIP